MFTVTLQQTNADIHERLGAALSDLSEFLTPFGQYVAQESSRRIRERSSYDPSVHPDPALSSTGITIRDVAPQSVSVGTSLPYARIQQEGGTIAPKPPGKALAIPVRDSLRALRGGSAGVTGWPRDIDPERTTLRFIPSPLTGSGIIGVLVDEQGTLGHGAGVLYILVAASAIKGQPYLFVDEDDWAVGSELLTGYLRGKGL